MRKYHARFGERRLEKEPYGHLASRLLYPQGRLEGHEKRATFQSSPAQGREGMANYKTSF